MRLESSHLQPAFFCCHPPRSAQRTKPDLVATCEVLPFLRVSFSGMLSIKGPGQLRRCCSVCVVIVCRYNMLPRHFRGVQAGAQQFRYCDGDSDSQLVTILEEAQPTALYPSCDWSSAPLPTVPVGSPGHLSTSFAHQPCLFCTQNAAPWKRPTLL